MGIDIYAHWAGQTDEEKQAQFTGFSVKHGHAGYLREAYHGGPYATRELVPESFDYPEGWDYDKQGDWPGAPIPYDTLVQRLPRTVMLALQREAEVYGCPKARQVLCMLGVEPKLANGSDPSVIQVEDEAGIVAAMAKIQTLVKAAGVEGAKSEHETPDALKHPEVLLALAAHFDTVAMFVHFVALCGVMERRTGEPCRIYASA